MTDHLDVAPAQADIVQLAVAQLGKGLAGDASIVPVGKCRKKGADGLNGTEDRDCAKGRGAGGLISGQGVNPF